MYINVCMDWCMGMHVRRRVYVWLSLCVCVGGVNSTLLSFRYRILCHESNKDDWILILKIKGIHVAFLRDPQPET